MGVLQFARVAFTLFLCELTDQTLLSPEEVCFWASAALLQTQK